MPATRAALSGVQVVEIGQGAAMSYCGRLLRDSGASVLRVPYASEGVAAPTDAAGQAYDQYLYAGKSLETPQGVEALQQLCASSDIVLIGEDANPRMSDLRGRRVTVQLTWFGDGGPYSHWKGSDLIVQALTAMPHLAGPVEGPPLYAGDRHSTMIGGVTAYIAALSGMLATPQRSRHFSVSILEANLVLSEMDIHFVERDGVALKRHGINRFSPNGPVGIYKCREGWIGITAVTPDQWRSLCVALEMTKEAADPGLATREQRFERLDEVEQAITAALAGKSAAEWARILRDHRVPGVVVPDADEILSHPIFNERKSLARLDWQGRTLKVARTAFGLARTPTLVDLGSKAGLLENRSETPTAPDRQGGDDAPLSGLTVADFTMGWAGPLASRLLADLGAEVLKIEAGRYPDWWRGVNWTPEFIAAKQYEDAKGYCALNRGKRGVSLDLTSATGRELAKALIGRAEAVIENQAAGVMDKLGLGYDELKKAKPDIVMTSMSAFGTGNDWSVTRAYGSTLEQGSGLPHFMGLPDTPPTMAHLAYGDPVGGLYGCASLLTALVHKRRTGEGQYVNVSMVEVMLQFATPSLLRHQTDPAAPLRVGNRNLRFAPHGIYPCSGQDRWVAISVDSAASFAQLCRLIGRPDLQEDPALQSVEGRWERHDAIDAAIRSWSTRQEPEAAALALQELGVAAAPVRHTEELIADPHLEERGFFIDLVRKYSGPQRQAGVAIIQDGVRLGARTPAPTLGEHSWPILEAHTDVSKRAYELLIDEGVICFAPAALRSGSPLGVTS
jgi:crotonobetainyl-CoA:carnitine CoA-transferase CaiB-like acyl-CoA transferase